MDAVAVVHLLVVVDVQMDAQVLAQRAVPKLVLLVVLALVEPVVLLLFALVLVLEVVMGRALVPVAMAAEVLVPIVVEPATTLVTEDVQVDAIRHAWDHATVG